MNNFKVYFVAEIGIGLDFPKGGTPYRLMAHPIFVDDIETHFYFSI